MDGVRWIQSQVKEGRGKEQKKKEMKKERREVIPWHYPTGWVTPRRRIEKKTTSQSSAKAPLYMMGAVRL